MPVISGGVLLTVSVVVTKQPEGNVYVMVVTPVCEPVSIPDVATILAMELLLLLQVPPVVASLNKVASPTHTSETPVIIPGKALTVTTTVAVQLPNEYPIVAVPGDTPNTFPDMSTVATLVLLLLQLPPPMASVKKVVAPLHKATVPVIGSGPMFTVTVVIAAQPELSI